MSFVRQRRLGDTDDTGDGFTDFVQAGGWTNPDGSPTYNGAPYNPSDLMNPYNFGSGPAVIPLQTGSSQVGTSPLNTAVPPPLINYTPGGNGGTIIASGLPPVAATPASTASGLTSILSSISSIFAPKPATGVALSPSGSALTVNPATSATIGGFSTSTLLLLGLVGVGAVVLLNKRRSA